MLPFLKLLLFGITAFLLSVQFSFEYQVLLVDSFIFRSFESLLSWRPRDSLFFSLWRRVSLLSSLFFLEQPHKVFCLAPLLALHACAHTCGHSTRTHVHPHHQHAAVTTLHHHHFTYLLLILISSTQPAAGPKMPDAAVIGPPAASGEGNSNENAGSNHTTQMSSHCGVYSPGDLACAPVYSGSRVFITVHSIAARI